MKKKPVFIAGNNLITSFGFTTDETIRKMKNDCSGFKPCTDSSLSPSPLPLSLIDSHQLEGLFLNSWETCKPGQEPLDYTRLEKLFILSVYDTIKELNSEIFGKDTLLVFSTTKGNINLLENEQRERYEPERVCLWKMAEMVRNFFGFVNKPLIISNACISGVLALSNASRLIQSGQYAHAVVCGGDILSEFVISGFTSFQALSQEPCKPFDASRNGLSLGEGCGTIILTSQPEKFSATRITIAGSATSNDANHISGPSRTGEELAMAITKAMHEAELDPSDISFISAHGTATLYNDAMESKAISLSGLSHSPVNSFKGYFGHTLGAAGIIESVLTIRCALDNMLFKSAGFSELGVPENLKIITSNTQAQVNNCLKTASGFGGCNAAIIFSKEK
jgi:3-oxoacyl-[acyl-carrier-protein] synthase I